MKLDEAITRFVDVLRQSPNGRHWCKKLNAQLGASRSNPPAAANCILGFYGGAGSLNDVWFDDPELDCMANRFSTELYDCCKAMAR